LQQAQDARRARDRILPVGALMAELLWIKPRRGHACI